MKSTSDSLSATEYALLGLLYSEPAHGYELHKRITDRTSIGMIWGLKLSNMYAQLDKLERMGLIKGKVFANEQRPARMEYTLTKSGKDLFDGWLFQPVPHPREIRHEFMVKVYFLSLLHPDKTAGVIETQLAACEEWEENTRDKETSLEESGSFQNIIYHFRFSQIQSMSEWLRWLKNQVSKK